MGWQTHFITDSFLAANITFYVVELDKLSIREDSLCCKGRTYNLIARRKIFTAPSLHLSETDDVHYRMV